MPRLQSPPSGLAQEMAAWRSTPPPQPCRTSHSPPLLPPAAARSRPAADPLVDVLTDLYCRQRAIDPEDAYLAAHGTPRFIASQVRSFRWYADYLPAGGAVLDWGCNHAPDSCLLRGQFGERFRLYACDFVEAGRYGVFGGYARAEYTQLGDVLRLPYADNSFAAVVGSGVLEHTAMDYEVLKELYRVLEPDGTLVLTYLPNRLSVEEWLRRVVHRRDFHRRLYGLGEARHLLRRTGFDPVAGGYQCAWGEKLARALGGGRWQRRLGAVLETLFLPRVLVSTLRLVARKVTVM